MARKLKLSPVNARRGYPATAYHLPPGQYWIGGVDGAAIKITVGVGHAGVAVRIHTAIMAPKLTISEAFDISPAAPEFKAPNMTFSEVSVCQYRLDEKSQAFRSWYLGTETEKDIEILGDEYRRKA